MALVDPRQTFFSEQTQSIANRMPQYHAGRRLKTSNWSRVMNDIWGLTLDDYRTQEEKAFRSLFIQTARLDEADLLREVFLPQGVDLTPPDVNVNILRNSSFELRSRPDKVGDFWNHSGTVRVEAPSFFGSTSVALAPASSETSRIFQVVSRDSWAANTSRTFSAWYRIASWAGGTVPSASHGLIVAVTYADATTQNFRAAFDQDTGDTWRRIRLTVTPAKVVHSYEVRLETARSVAFDIDTPVRVDAVQAEASGTASTWRSNISDKPNWFLTEIFPPIEFDSEAPIFITDELRDFYDEAIPTRVENFRNRALVVPANRGGGIGEAIDYFGDRWAFRWDIDTANNKIRKIGIDPLDIYATYDLSFFTGTDTGDKFEEGVTGITYRCVTQFQRWLWVVHTMPDLNGGTILALSLAEYRTPYPSPTHLESKYTLQLPLDETLDYHRVTIQFEDPQHIYISTGDTEFALRLFYDYAMLEPRTLRAFMREKYTSLALVR